MRKSSPLQMAILQNLETSYFFDDLKRLDHHFDRIQIALVHMLRKRALVISATGIVSVSIFLHASSLNNRYSLPIGRYFSFNSFARIPTVIQIRPTSIYIHTQIVVLYVGICFLLQFYFSSYSVANISLSTQLT